MLVGDGRIDIDEPAPVPEFVGTNKASITVRDLLAMKPGLEFNEDYVDESTSHCIDMLFGAGTNDHAQYAASQQLLHEPGTVWNYASAPQTSWPELPATSWVVAKRACVLSSTIVCLRRWA
jgi:CubicO group peptidase (beta-lactamase class C family)